MHNSTHTTATHGLAKAYGLRLREVPIPQDAIDPMDDVLAATTDIGAEGGTAHSTLRGTHNLAT